jgi:hypothetical protein
MGMGFGIVLVAGLTSSFILVALFFLRGAFTGNALATAGAAFQILYIFYGAYMLWAAATAAYRITPDRLSIRFGLRRREYQWAEFESAFHSRGSVPFKLTFTPCTRLSNPVVLRRRHGLGTVELTPDNPQAFLQRLGALVPQLAQGPSAL